MKRSYKGMLRKEVNPMGMKIETAIQIEKPGAKPGQVILAIDLTKIEFPVKALSVGRKIGSCAFIA